MENKEKMKHQYDNITRILNSKYYVTRGYGDDRFDYYYNLLSNYWSCLVAKYNYDTTKAKYQKQLFFAPVYFNIPDDARLLRAIEMENDGKLPDDIQAVINEIILEII